MFSYLNPPQSSSSSQPSTQLVQSELAKLKSQLTAVPYGHSALSGKRKKKSKESVISKSYNPAASRPIAIKRNNQAMITVNMRIDFPAAFSTSTIASTFGASSFTLGQFNGTAQYTGLFDQYRFDEFELWMEPQSAYLSSTNVGVLTSAVDVDDANVPGTIEAVEDHQNSLATTGSCGHYHRWKPHMAVALYSGVFTSFGNDDADWIDSASNTVQHYGIKYASTATTAIQAYNLSVRARVSFRNPGI